MSSDGKYHTTSCTRKKWGHSDGKWCWSSTDIESLEKQHAEHKTWNQIADSFKFYNAQGVRTCYRHHSHACHSKMSALRSAMDGKAKSHNLVRLGKRSRSMESPCTNPFESPLNNPFESPLEKQQEADNTKKKPAHGHEEDEDTDEDTKEAEAAIKKVIIKLELDSE